MSAIYSTRNIHRPLVPNRAKLCEQCRSLSCVISIKRWPCNVGLRAPKGSECPLCLFFAAVLTAKQSPVVHETLYFKLFDYKGPSTVAGPNDFLFQNYYIQSQESSGSRFMLPEYGIDELHFRPLPKDSVDYPLLRKWIASCREDHGYACSFHGDKSALWDVGRSRLKVIDCLSSNIITAPEGAEYVALSYVWGRPSASNAYESPPPDGIEGYRLMNLPETIRDAMRVTLELGYAFLWCDKYCFDQRADPHQLQNQLSLMATIYSAAAVTIVAAAGDHYDYGLPGVGLRHRITPPAIRLNVTVVSESLVNSSGRIYWRRVDQILSDRTYQEEFYSRVQLIFTEDQVVFECNAMSCFESVTVEDLTGSVEPYRCLSSAYTRSIWDHPLHEHITRYTRRNLSYQSDILNAMRGLFNSLSLDKPHWQQYWGTPLALATGTDMQSKSRSWSDVGVYQAQSKDAQHYLQAAFFRALCWIADHGTRTRHAPLRREGFPSWPWCGWITPVHWVDTFSLGWDTMLPLEVYVIRTDNSEEPLSEALALAAFEQFGDPTSIYTCKLHIRAEVLYLRFVCLEDEGLKPHRVYTGTTGAVRSIKYAAKGNVDTGYPSRITKSHWLLDVPPGVYPHDELYYALCHHVFEGIVVSEEYVLVTRTQNYVTERIGLISTRGLELTWDERNGRHPREFFPGCWRDIVLE